MASGSQALSAEQSQRSSVKSATSENFKSPQVTQSKARGRWFKTAVGVTFPQMLARKVRERQTAKLTVIKAKSGNTTAPLNMVGKSLTPTLAKKDGAQLWAGVETGKIEGRGVSTDSQAFSAVQTDPPAPSRKADVKSVSKHWPVFGADKIMYQKTEGATKQPESRAETSDSEVCSSLYITSIF